VVFFYLLFDKSISKPGVRKMKSLTTYGWLLATYAVETWQHTLMFLQAFENFRIFIAPIALIFIFRSTLKSKSTEAALLITISTSFVILS